MTRPDSIQAPTLEQSVSVFQLIRFGRKLVSQGNTFTPDDAVEFRRLMNRTSTAFDLPLVNDNTSLDDVDRAIAAVASEIGASA